jgi:hypothetical protein
MKQKIQILTNLRKVASEARTAYRRERIWFAKEHCPIKIGQTVTIREFRCGVNKYVGKRLLVSTVTCEQYSDTEIVWVLVGSVLNKDGSKQVPLRQICVRCFSGDELGWIN